MDDRVGRPLCALGTTRHQNPGHACGAVQREPAFDACSPLAFVAGRRPFIPNAAVRLADFAGRPSMIILGQLRERVGGKER